MAQNGAAVRLTLAPEHPSTPVGDGIESQIGEATAAAVIVLCQAMQEFQAGGLTPATRMAGGERIAKVCELRMAAHGIDFPATAHREGKVMLRRHFDAEYPQGGAAAVDAALDEFVDGVLQVVDRVAEHERALAN